LEFFSLINSGIAFIFPLFQLLPIVPLLAIYIQRTSNKRSKFRCNKPFQTQKIRCVLLSPECFLRESWSYAYVRLREIIYWSWYTGDKTLQIKKNQYSTFSIQESSGNFVLEFKKQPLQLKIINNSKNHQFLFAWENGAANPFESQQILITIHPQKRILVRSVKSGTRKNTQRSTKKQPKTDQTHD
jgi:hypothetical protein